MYPSATGVQSRSCYFRHHSELFILFVPSDMKLPCVVAPPSNQGSGNYGGKFSWAGKLFGVGSFIII